MSGIVPKHSQQEEMSIPIPRGSTDNHFQNIDMPDVDVEDEGWFTPIESKRLSQKFPNKPLVSNETQKKLQMFYSDIDGSFIDAHHLQK